MQRSFRGREVRFRPSRLYGQNKSQTWCRIVRRDAESPHPARNIELPVLLMHGTEDRLSNSQGSAYLFEVVKSEDKKLNYYQGFWREILNEPGRERVLNDILEWLVAHRGVNPVATAAGAALARGY